MASRDWVDPGVLDGLSPAGCPSPAATLAVDALLGLIETVPVPWQAATGLRWIDELIGGDYATIAVRSWRLPAWLERLRASGQLQPSESAAFQRIRATSTPAPPSTPYRYSAKRHDTGAKHLDMGARRFGPTPAGSSSKTCSRARSATWDLPPTP
jgi:hypothetical protein